MKHYKDMSKNREKVTSETTGTVGNHDVTYDNDSVASKDDEMVLIDMTNNWVEGRTDPGRSIQDLNMFSLNSMVAHDDDDVSSAFNPQDSLSSLDSAEEREKAIRDGFLAFLYNYIGCALFAKVFGPFLSQAEKVVRRILRKVRGGEDDDDDGDGDDFLPCACNMLQQRRQPRDQTQSTQ